MGGVGIIRNEFPFWRFYLCVNAGKSLTNYMYIKSPSGFNIQSIIFLSYNRTLPAQLGQLKTGQDGKGLLRIHLWCPDDLPRLWDRIE